MTRGRNRDRISFDDGANRRIGFGKFCGWVGDKEVLDASLARVLSQHAPERVFNGILLDYQTNLITAGLLDFVHHGDVN